jgi:hypothetical protein
MTMARNKFAFLAAGIVFAMTFTLSCSEDSGSSGGENSSSSENNPSDNSSSSSLNSSSSLGALSSSSSSDDNPSSSSGVTLSCSYLSCEEMGKLMNDANFMGGDPSTYMDNLENSCKTKPEIQQCTDRKCAVDILMACMSEDKDVKQLCGCNGLEACKEHYDTECNGDSDPDGYVSCEELESLAGGDPDAYWNNVMNSCETEHMSELQNCRNKQCGENIIFACMEKDEKIKKACGGNNVGMCANHYDNACGLGN